jgi:hypothetical protein
VLPHDTKHYLLQSYYSFDERVVREILGKKLTSRARKELEEIVSKTRIPISGCRRMFDNLKRISKRLEDAPSSAGSHFQDGKALPNSVKNSMVELIQHDFGLNPELAT